MIIVCSKKCLEFWKTLSKIKITMWSIVLIMIRLFLCLPLQLASWRGWYTEDRCPLSIDGRRGKLQLAICVPCGVPASRERHGGQEEGALLQPYQDGAPPSSHTHHADMGQWPLQSWWLHRWVGVVVWKLSARLYLKLLFCVYRHCWFQSECDAPACERCWQVYPGPGIRWSECGGDRRPVQEEANEGMVARLWGR